MHVNEVTPAIYKICSLIASLKTYSTGYFCGMTLNNFILMLLFVVAPLLIVLGHNFLTGKFP